MAFNIDDPIGSLGLGFGELQSGAYDIAQYVIYLLIIVAVGWYVWKIYSDKKIFKYPVRIFRRRSNGLIREFNSNGGYIKKGKSDETIFIIKMGFFKTKELPRLPNSELIDEDDRIYYYQLSPEAPLIQCKRTFNVERVFLKNEDYVEPSAEEKEVLMNRYIIEIKKDKANKELTDEEIKLMALERLEEEIQTAKERVEDVTSVYYTPIPVDQKLQAYHDIRKLSNTLGVDVNKQFAYFIVGVIAMCIVGAVIFYIAVNKGDIPIITKFAPLIYFGLKNKKFK
jgi:hypothetical protein